ncbi:hypothetical protein [Streptomyces triculaminicus]
MSRQEMWQRDIHHAQENLRLGRITVNHDRKPVKVLLNFTHEIEL